MTIVGAAQRTLAAGRRRQQALLQNQYNLLALMLKDNIVTIDWSDEVIARPC